MRIPTIAALLFLIASATPSLAQVTRDTNSICYHFVQGQTVSYRVLSRDSVAIWDVVPRTVVRHRTETLKYTCDSVLPNGDFLLSVTMTAYSAKEWFNSTGPQESTTHPWVGHTVQFIMDSIGTRKSLVLYESESPSTSGSPGGPFQPSILPFMGIEIGKSTAIYQLRQPMFENGYPPPIVSGSVMRQTKGRADTLQQRTLRVDLSAVASLAYQPPALPGKTAPPSLASRINGSGSYRINPSLGYPITGEYQLIADITMYSPDSTVTPVKGRHILGTMYHIDDAHTNALIKIIENAGVDADNKGRQGKPNKVKTRRSK